MRRCGLQPAISLRAARAGIPVALAVVAFVVASAAKAASDPPWLRLAAGTAARVDLAPWPTYDEPEAALVSTSASLERDFTADLARPNDVVYEPVGIRVRVVRVTSDGRIALVRARDGSWMAYAPVDQLVPDIPVGTPLRSAGSFAGFADLSPKLDATDSVPIATGTELIALGMGVARFDGSADLVRVRVRVVSGDARGREGWIPAKFTGIPLTGIPAGAENAAKACSCRIVRFEGIR